MTEGAGAGREGWRSYRCPVCGHTEGVGMGDRETLMTRCSHCETELELWVRTEMAASAKVAEPRPGRRRRKRERA